jgi:hypothetical protein
MRNGTNPHVKTLVIECLIQKLTNNKTIEVLENYGYKGI